jgi:Ran GTPase-activating protein (RanGAP) involved in mRNA processing and transport
LSGNPLGKLGGLAVAEFLQNNRILHELHLDNTEIDLDVLVAIAAVLHVNNQTLQVLSVENPRLVNLQGEHTYHFSRMLRVNTGLQEIYLGKHRIRDGDVQIMVSYLMENMALKVLDLRCNEIGAAGAEALAKWLRTPGCQLRKLNLSANRIGEKEATAGVEALADSLLPNKMLCHLDLNHNRLCSNALVLLSRAIDQCEAKQIRMNLFHSQWDDAAARAFHLIFADSSRVFPVEADFETHEQGDHIAVTELRERSTRY